MLSSLRVMVVWIVVGVVIVAVIVLLVIEGRVMRKPEADRTDGERRFLSADRAAGRGYQAYSRKVAPWIAVAAAVIGLVGTVPLWAAGRVGVAAELTILFVALGGGMVALWATVLRKRGPGSAWRAAEDDRVNAADAAGRPRWFVSVRAGWWLGGVATGLGVLAVIGALNGLVGIVSAVVILTLGVVFLVLAALQARGQHRSRP